MLTHIIVDKLCYLLKIANMRFMLRVENGSNEFSKSNKSHQFFLIKRVYMLCLSSLGVGPMDSRRQILKMAHDVPVFDQTEIPTKYIFIVEFWSNLQLYKGVSRN